jgi:hypothetical protein
MKKFNSIEAENYIDKLLKFYNIKVRARSKSNSGVAYIEAREVKIPYSTDVVRFGVALHEIKHIIDGCIKPSWLGEWRCEQYAIKEIEKLGFDATDYIQNAKRYMRQIFAKAYNRKANLDKIDKEFLEFTEAPLDIMNEYKGYNVYFHNDAKIGGRKFRCMHLFRRRPKWDEAFFEFKEGKYQLIDYKQPLA